MKRLACPDCLLQGTVQIRQQLDLESSESPPTTFQLILCNECNFKGMAFFHKSAYDGVPLDSTSFHKLEKLICLAADKGTPASVKAQATLLFLLQEISPPGIPIDWSKRFPMELETSHP